MLRAFALAAAAVFAAAIQPSVPSSDAGSSHALTDSGLDYTESSDTIFNPAAGYTTTVWANCAPGNTPVYSPTGSLVLFFINIGQFSSGVNGTASENGTYTPGEDFDLDSAFFMAMRTATYRSIWLTRCS
ncbi:MAG: hypothetical protein IKO47_09455 [Ruminococcus sp.]|nr:hypothetical protein [Ruminococcus sp.]